MKIAEINKQKVRDFLRFIEEGRSDKIADIFAENGEHENVYASGLFPEKVRGRKSIEEYWNAPIANFEKMEFPIDELLAMEDPTMIYMKFKGIITLKNGEGIYANDYYATFKFNEKNEIMKYVEIFNPIVAARGFGMLDQIK